MENFKNFLIMGYGKSGQAVAHYLIKKRKKIVIYDKNAQIFNKNAQNGVKFSKIMRYKFIDSADMVVVSPSISVFNKYIVYAKKTGKKVISELEFGYLINKRKKIIGITGTNGKTTTTMLVRDMLKEKCSCEAFGNIGTPLTSAYGQKLDYISLEVSSFQLELIDAFKPKIAVILNIDVDHLDRHKTIENYISVKLNIVKNARSSTILVLNADDKVISENDDLLKGNKYYFSKTKIVKGIYIKNNKIYLNINQKPQQIAKISDFNLPFNIIDDVLASILVGYLCKVDKKSILKALSKFKLAPYRMETKVINGIKIINDSKGTNIHSTVSALRGQNNVILLLGGEDKGLNFSPIFKQNVSGVKQIICFGKTANNIYETAKKCNFNSVLQEKNCKSAVFSALNMAKSGDTILFSPACSSFDEFSSYAERGKFFDEIVNNFFKTC
ncbi:MAG: UDP-N-acetylmuramoyl-L-alanine--D-glutamate ligase [Clostridia bacterium]|nr:UDP-N-acetylmuramoyl-L-alanine--D-glutamate ligase [Clostridia bacterium]